MIALGKRKLTGTRLTPIDSDSVSAKIADIDPVNTANVEFAMAL
jgi:hypothetical protein